MDMTTPAVLFPAVSLLLLAYTNRFLVLATLIRSLHDKHQSKPDATLLAQIRNLRHRVILIRNMQAAGVASLLTCVVCMLFVFLGQLLAAKVFFGLSLLLMTISLSISLREILISVTALTLQLRQLEFEEPRNKTGDSP
jgi:hypothetical protein